MNTVFSPFFPAFETPEQEASHTAWLQAKAAASLADTRPAIPHDEVERRMAARWKNCVNIVLPDVAYILAGIG